MKSDKIIGLVWSREKVITEKQAYFLSKVTHSAPPYVIFPLQPPFTDPITAMRFVGHLESFPTKHKSIQVLLWFQLLWFGCTSRDAKCPTSHGQFGNVGPFKFRGWWLASRGRWTFGLWRKVSWYLWSRTVKTWPFLTFPGYIKWRIFSQPDKIGTGKNTKSLFFLLDLKS